jgi:hypothetical protein
MRFFVEDLSCVTILRLKMDSLTNTKIATCAAKEAARYLSNDYWTPGALTAFSPKTPRRERKEVFCSHLVASAYEAAGIRLVQSKTTDKVTPADLAASPLLVSVTHVVLKPVAYDIARLWGTSLEQGLSDRPHIDEIVKAREVRDQVNKWLRDRKLPEQANFYELLNFLRDSLSGRKQQDMDEVFSRALQETGYLKILHQSFPDNAPVFEGSSQLQLMLEQGALADHQIQEFREVYNHAHAEHLKDSEEKKYMLQWYENAWEHRRLETFRLLADNQQQVCKLSAKILREIQACLRLCGEDISSSEQSDP